MEKLKSFWNKIVTFAFRRTKRFYIILIVISSIVLLADLSVRLLVPDLSRFTSLTQTVTSFDGSDVTLPDSAASGDADFDLDSDSSMPDMSDMQDFSGTFEQQSMTVVSEESSTDVSDSAGGNDAASEGAAAGSGAADGAAGGMQGGTDMQGGFASGDAASMPDMSGGSDMTVPDGNSQSTASGDTSEDTEDDTSEASNTFSIGLPLRILMGIRAAFWPIFLIAALIDGLSIAMLVLIRRREKKAAEEAEKERIAEAFASDTEVHLVRPAAKKQKISPVTWILIIVAIIVLLSVVRILSAATAEEASETEATVYEEAVESGDISTVLPGTGTLTEEDAVEISLPSEVEITEWYVTNGDTVEEGDVLAAVDTNSALTAIASVQEVITSLDEALAELEDSDTDAEVTAAAGGRVKAVYAAEDAGVIDTIYESGALLLLSLDGKMAVSFETETEVTVGDAVTVTLSDGTEEDGTVESAIDGTVVVTLTDEDTDYGDSVTVTDADGNELGSGELYIHSELKVYAFSGTVDSVSVDVEDEVDAGDTLLSLTDVDNTFETALLVEQRSVLEEQIATLFTLYQDGYLYAETAGVVSGISDSSDTSSDSSDSTDSSDESGSDSTDSTDDTEASGTSGSASAAGIIQTAYAAGASYSAVTLTASADDTDGTSAEQVTDDAADDTDSTDSGDTDTDTTDSDSTDSDDTDSDSGSSDDEDSEDTSGSESSYTNYMALVTAVSGSTATAELYALSGSELGTATTAEISLSGTIYVSADGTITGGSASDVEAGDTLILICSADDTAQTLTPVLIIVAQSAVSEDSDTQSSDTDESDSDGSDTQSDDTQTGSGSTDQGTQQDESSAYGDSSAQTDASDASALTSGTDTSALTSGTDTSALADTASTDAASAVTETLTEEVTTTYSVSETTLLSVTPQDYVYVTITVDELDILSIETGLEAEVTLDAFPGQSFTGVVDSIDTSGTNAGGNSKYTAVVKIERTEDMLSGMNASVKITLDTTEDVLYVPADAIVEDEDGTYVYTSYDEKTDTLGDPVEVETGVSDGTNVEIVSGLSAGDTYYYSVLDTVNYSTSTSSSAAGGFSFSFGGGGMGGGF